MIKRALLWILPLLFLASAGFAQSDAGKLKGKVTDDAGEPVPFATVKVIQNGIVKGGSNTDSEGYYSIVAISPGVYTVIASFAGQEKELDNVTITVGKTKTLDISMTTDVDLGPVEIYEPIEFDQTTTVQSFDKTQVRESGYRDINSVVAIAAGAVPNERDGGINIRGQRGTSTVYFVDGVKMRGVISLPQKSIETINVITGGTPAEYGDMIGGVVSITTAGPSYQLTGGGEILTSTIFPKPYVGLDPYGYTLVGLNASGPIITKYDSVSGYGKTILGFMIAGEYEYKKDQDPAFGGVPTLRAGLLDSLQASPTRLDETGSFFVQKANYLTADDFTSSKVKTYNVDRRARVSGRLDFQPNDNIIVKLGGTYENIKSDSWGLGSALLAPEGNQLFKGFLARGWGRFQQQFKGGEGSKLKNLFYMLQADYQLYHREFMNRDHRKNIFDYGHVGTFNWDRQEVFLNTAIFPDLYSPTVSPNDYFVTVGYAPNNLTFDASTSKNPLLANYNKFIFETVQNNGIVNPFTQQREYSINSTDLLAFYRGLRNGDSPQSIYSLYSGTGSQTTSYYKYNFEQYRFSGQASGEFGGHNFKLGFEFEQRDERFFFVAASPLWNYMRQLANRHLATISDDVSQWELVTVDGVFQDTARAPIQYLPGDQSTFDKNLRLKLGLPVTGTDFIITDNLDPSTFSLDMFSADELLNDGNSYIAYYGYDYTGNRSAPVSVNNFFTDKANRPMNSFAPTYIAGFVQDKFELEDIIFNFGLRVDRFDANQKVLKDLYNLFPAYTAGEIVNDFGPLPDGIGENFIPYMDNSNAPSAVVGYRDPDKNIWYDATGAPTSSASLRQGGKVQPYLKGNEVSIASFEDYTPQTIVMPRLSFSFPISGEAVFFAHYDVLAQRPGQTGSASGSLLAGQISDYFFLQNSATVQVTNPNLKPERTIDYEVGFKQRVNDFMALSVSAFYREMRDLIQSLSFVDAYPLSYSSYANIDFGTVKGFTFALNMLRKKNIRMNVSYTLQFAAGTGSSFGSSRNALNSIEGFTAIRTLLPLDFDQRHRFTGNIDYRFFGDDRGPAIKLGKGDGAKTIYPFSNAGLNATFGLTSGTPYSVNSLANPAQVQSGINQSIQLAGTPNGSRLPWQFKLDLKIDKDFVLGGGVKKDKEGNNVVDGMGAPVNRKEYAINVYLLFLNALNTKNILNVYKTSGLPNDDGYLNTGVGQQAVAASINPSSFEYLYALRAMNPGNYSVPRRIRLGLQLSF
ncbi:MAG: carboxypeptidase regulatory-like domain-containing protein [Bacteroidia bacterium]|nr:carboxypeptidase regulatory-like domain-containing protein [Bacteroidia bacterium]